MGLLCEHCGEDCGKHPVFYDEKPFCCHGCKTVYQILDQKELKKYYSIEKTPGIRLDDQNHGDKYAYLDLDDVKDNLLEFSDGNISKVKFFIPSIHCASCIWLLENLHTLNPDIIQSAVNFPKKEISITFRHDNVSLRQLVELLASIHYIPEITSDRMGRKQPISADRLLLLKIGVAGFVLMNVMMYNFPEYLPGGKLLEEEFKSFFGYLSLVLSIPVVVYCASDYYLTAIKSLKHRIISIDLPIALGVLTLFLQSAWEIISGTGIGFLDSLAGLVFFLLIGKWYQGKTYHALSFERDYKSYFPVAVTLLRDGKEETISLKNLQPGDKILVRNQELIPADGTILKGEGNIDYSFVTGESVPVLKRSGEPVYAGGRQVGSSIEMEVTREVEQSYLTQLWNQDNKAGEDETRLNQLINKVSQYFTLIILTIAFASGIYWLPEDRAVALFAFTSVLIVACPCALALTIPFTFGSTMRQYGRRGLYIKKTDVVELLNKIDTVVFDKTGTITQSRTVDIAFEGDILNEDQLGMIKSLVKHSTHPLSAALFRHLDEYDVKETDTFREIPSLGISGVINGVKINIGSRKFVMGKEEETGLQTRVWVFIGDRVYGYFTFQNQYRQGLKDVITELAKRYELHLLTGDNEAERENLTGIFGEAGNLHFNQSPADKLNYIRSLKNSGKNVLMVGDGLNDAGALNESNVGISIADDIYHFSPACDAILESGKFGMLDKYIDFSGKSMGVVKISFVISFLYNVLGLFFAVQGILTPVIAAILMPVSSISVVAFATWAVSVAAGKTFSDKSRHVEN